MGRCNRIASRTVVTAICALYPNLAGPADIDTPHHRAIAREAAAAAVGETVILLLSM